MSKLLEVSRCAGDSRIVTRPSLEHTGMLTWL